MKATAKDLRFHSKELLEAVERGEEVTITYRGEPRAKLVPAGKAKKRNFKDSPAFGMWQDNPEVKDVEEFVKALRRDREF